MTNRVLTIVLLLGLFSNMLGNFLFGQAAEYKTPLGIDLYPKSPEAYAFSKYVDIPAGNHTGVANFSIPFYSINVDGLTIPIQLDYNTNGVKVDEIAGRVGLGWFLNTGAGLSGQTIGLPDITGNFRFINTDTFVPNLFNREEIYYEAYNLALSMTGQLDGGVTDTKPDLYSYSIPGSSGKFVIDPEKAKGIPIPYNDIKIKTGGVIEIIDVQGNIYIFHNRSQTVSHNSCSRVVTSEAINSNPEFTIKKIITKNKREINFLYEKPVNTKYALSFSEQYRVDEKKAKVATILNFVRGPIPPAPFCINYMYSYDPVLTKIEFPEGEVLFKYNDEFGLNRDDLDGDFYIKKVIVKNKKNEELRNYDLNYTYFESAPLSLPNLLKSNLTGLGLTISNKRLKLTGIQENLSNQVYNLEYYEDKPFPHRFSFSHDYWGVYNGKNLIVNNGTSSIPQIMVPSLEGQGPITYKKYPQELNKTPSDKTPDFEFGKIGSLKKITYPTGGSTEIEYEADDYIAPEEYEKQYTDYIFHTNTNTQIPTEFQVQANGIYAFTVMHSGSNDDGSGNDDIRNCKLSILDKSNNVDLLSNVAFGGTRQYGTFEVDPQKTYGKTFKMTVTPGTDLDGNPATCNAKVTWSHETEVLIPEQTKKTGTIRVKKIQNVDENQNKIIRQYIYKDPDTNKTSGVLTGEYNFYPIYRRPFIAQETLEHGIQQFISNNPGWMTNSVKGKTVTYSYVQDLYINEQKPAENYKAISEFLNEGGDLSYDYRKYLNFYWPLRTFKNGLLRETNYFDNLNNKTKKIEYKYEFDPYFNKDSSGNLNHCMVGCGTDIVILIDNGEVTLARFDYNNFLVPNYWIKDTLVRTTNYVNGFPTLIEEELTDYQSESAKHTFPISKTTTSSLGETLRTEYYYPPDLTSYYEQSTLMNKMVGRNQIASPVITKTFQNGTATSEQRIHYAHFHESTTNSDAGFILPKYVYTKKGEIGTTSTSADRKITYDYYDNKGNLTEYTLDSGIPVSIIWGYNGQYPIAKVEGVRNSEITTYIGTLQGLSDDGTLVSASFDQLRTAVNAANKFAMLTCYIYQPLVGVKEIISPNGQKETYEYDTFGRLMHVKDHNGNILKKLEYNYKH